MTVLHQMLTTQWTATPGVISSSKIYSVLGAVYPKLSADDIELYQRLLQNDLLSRSA